MRRAVGRLDEQDLMKHLFVDRSGRVVDLAEKALGRSRATRWSTSSSGGPGSADRDFAREAARRVLVRSAVTGGSTRPRSWPGVARSPSAGPSSTSTSSRSCRRGSARSSPGAMPRPCVRTPASSRVAPGGPTAPPPGAEGPGRGAVCRGRGGFPLRRSVLGRVSQSTNPWWGLVKRSTLRPAACVANERSTRSLRGLGCAVDSGRRFEKRGLRHGRAVPCARPAQPATQLVSVAGAGQRAASS